MIKVFISLFLLCFTNTMFAAVYQKTDANGDITYSDVPMPNAEQLDLPDQKTPVPNPTSGVNHLPSGVTLPPDQADIPTAYTDTSAANKPYTACAITSPTNGQTFQNARNIAVTITSVPDLQSGDRVQLFVDNSPSGNLMASTSLVAKDLERGTHTVSASIVNKNGQTVAQANSVTIYVHYASLGAGNVAR